MEKRAERRHSNGAKRESTLGVQTEPEAAVQKTKRGEVLPYYKVSIVVDENRQILGSYVHPTSEIEAIGPMLRQAQEITDWDVKKLLVDGLYSTGPVVKTGVDCLTDTFGCESMYSLLVSGRLIIIQSEHW